MADRDVAQSLRHNIRQFAAAKQRRVIEELLARKTKYPNRADWERTARSALTIRHHGAWWRAELQGALVSAQAAETWQEQQRRKDLYPNLKYETVGDDRVRPSHAALDGVVRPIGDPFWEQHYPPIAWNCRCKVIQTDEEVTPPRSYNFAPSPGFDHNPGITQRLFSESHPYFTLSPSEAQVLAEETNRLTVLTAPADWLRDTDAGREVFRLLKGHVDDLLGFDEASSGFLLIHRGHQPQGLEREIAAAQTLRREGHRVWLLNEPPVSGLPDAVINNRYVEIKQLRDAQNVAARFHKHIEEALRNSPNVLVHIAQSLSADTLQQLVRDAARRRPALRHLIIVYKGKSYHLDRKEMKRGQWLP